MIDVPVVDRRLREAFDVPPVRPRTKEVFIGHPALVASLYMGSVQGAVPVCLYGALVGMVGLICGQFLVPSYSPSRSPLAGAPWNGCQPRSLFSWCSLWAP